MSIEVSRDQFVISTDRDRLDVDAIHAYLSHSYWAAGIPRELVARSIQGSLCFGLYLDKTQIGFARVISDRATFAYLADVYVLEGYRGLGLAKWLMSVVMSHPDLQGVRRFMLVTRDAHGLYEQYGFRQIESPRRLMEIVRLDVYGSASGTA